MTSMSHPSQNDGLVTSGGKAPVISRELWDDHKEVIREYYVEGKMQMRDLVKAMEENHGFLATESQYWPKLRQWGFAKNKKRARATDPSSSDYQRRPASPSRGIRSRISEDHVPVDGSNTQVPAIFQSEQGIIQDDTSITAYSVLDPTVHSSDGIEPTLPAASTQSIDIPASVGISENGISTTTFQNSSSLNASAGLGRGRTSSPSINSLSHVPRSYIAQPDGIDYLSGTGNYFDLTAPNAPQLGWNPTNSGASFQQAQVYFGHLSPGQYSQPYFAQPQCLLQQRTVQPSSYDKRFQPGTATPFEINSNPNITLTQRVAPLSGGNLSSSLKIRQPIHQAAQARSVRGVQVLLDADPSCASVRGSDGVTPVAIAAQNGSIKIVQVLADHLEVPGGLELANFETKRTALHQAAQKGHFEVVKFLLEKGVNSDPKDHENVTPLWCAAQEGFHKIVKLLLANKADPNIASYDGSRRPIHQAAQNGHIDVVRLLLDGKADPDEEDSSNISPLWSASQGGHHAIVEMLLSCTTTKFNVEVASTDGGRRPIHQAAQNGHVKVVEALLNYGAKGDPEVDTYDDKVPSPLWLAAQNGSVKIATLLINKKANPDFAINPSRRRPLHQASQNGHTDIVRLLIGCRADLNGAEEGGWPPMMIAAQQGYLPIVKLLIDGGADINAEEKDGATSLWIASQQGHVDVVNLLLQNGAKSSSTKSASRRPIHQAAQNGHLEVVKLLVEHDAEEVDVEDGKGWRPLTFAAQESEEKYLAMMKYLIEKGAKPTNS